MLTIELDSLFTFLNLIVKIRFGIEKLILFFFKPKNILKFFCNIFIIFVIRYFFSWV